jgi:membrane protein YqaA with SNARE-associated domain
VDLSHVAGSRSPRHRSNALIALGLAAAVGAAAALARPEARALVAYGFYAVAAHLLISFMAHEPYLFYAAKIYPPPVVAVVGTAACLVAILVDYWLIGWVVRHRMVAPKLDQSRAFRTAERWFGKAPFLLIVVTALAPVPFYPTKILAIAGDYPIRRFMLALVAGRFPRFWLLALGGQKMQASSRGLLYAGVGLGVIAIVGFVRRWRAARRADRPSP